MKVVVLRGDAADRPSKRRLGVALCGGGLTGGMFEIGVLNALNDVLGIKVEDEADEYVGTSAGASLAVPLAQGVSAERLYKALYLGSKDPFFPISRKHLIPLELGWWLHGAYRMAGGFLSGLGRWATRRARGGLLDEVLVSVVDALPRGLVRLNRYRRFYERFLARNGFTEFFDQLPKPLSIPTNDVDSGRRVIFDRTQDVPISTAIAASSAIPIMYEPVRIRGRDYFDGGIGRVAHADILADHGCTHVLIVNPVVPIQYDRTDRNPIHTPRLADQGMMWVFNQCYRIMNKVKLHIAMDALIADYPHLSVLLVEPGEDESVMFLHDSMGDDAREIVLEYARSGAHAAFTEHKQELEAFFGAGDTAEQENQAAG